MSKSKAPQKPPAVKQEATEEAPKIAPSRRNPSELPPDSWTVLVSQHWLELDTASLEYRAGARGPFLPLADATLVILEPRGPKSGAVDVAKSLWLKATAHCEEEGGPIDYRLVLTSEGGAILGQTTKASRLDVTSPDGRARDLPDDDKGALLKSALALCDAQTRTVSARDRGIEAVVAACGQALSAATTALATVIQQSAALQQSSAANVTAEAEAWLAKAEFTRETMQDKEAKDADFAFRDERQAKAWAWLDAHGGTIADAIAQQIAKFSSDIISKDKTPA